MSNRPSDDLRHLAEELSDLIASNSTDKERANSLIAKLGLSNKNKADKNKAAHNQESQERIGIWNREPGDKRNFVRDERFSREWYAWADVNVIPEKSNKKRIVYLGESVARGFLYDPLYNPAEVLRSILGTHDDIEVIDLARLNIELNQLKQLCLSSLALEPDLLVCFAGNNWGPALLRTLSTCDLASIDSSMKEIGGPAKVKKVLEEKLKTLTSDFVSLLNRISKQCKIPIVYIIPEFNLRDWKATYLERSTPWIDNGKTIEWIDAMRKAVTALAEGDINLAEMSALQMRTLDGSKHPYPLELLSECKIKNGYIEEARTLLEEARDTALFGSIQSKPRRFSATRSTLISELENHQIPFIDLKILFKEHLKGGLPGKELFLDYCHLNADGIVLVMKQLAKKILSLLCNKDVSIDDLSIENTIVNSDVDGLAHFFAAIHNADCGQPYEILLYHCEYAIKKSSRATKLMLDYMDFAIRKTPTIFCKSHESFIETMQNEKLPIQLIYKASNLDLIEGMIAALRSVGVEKKKNINYLLNSEHGVFNGKVNLLDAHYQLKSREDLFGNERIYYQSHNFQSRFMFFAKKDDEVDLQIVCRIPSGEYANQDILIKLNDTLITLFEGNTSWKSHAFRLSSAHINNDINIICIEWPIALSLKAAASISFLERIVYGEISALTLFQHPANK